MHSLKNRFPKCIVGEPSFSKGAIPNFQIPRACFSPKYCPIRGPSPALEVYSIIVDSSLNIFIQVDKILSTNIVS